EAGAEIEDGVDPLRDRLLDKIVNDDRADHDIPAKIDRQAAFMQWSVVFPRQLAGQRVAEQRTRQLGLTGAARGDQKGRIGNVVYRWSHQQTFDLQLSEK